MTFDEEQEFVAAAKFYVSNNLELNRLSDDEPRGRDRKCC